jgi:ketosteroid isomerase-like protein
LLIATGSRRRQERAWLIFTGGRLPGRPHRPGGQGARWLLNKLARNASRPTLDATASPQSERRISPMLSTSKSDAIRRCFAAYRSKNRQAVEALLTDDFRFTSPYDDEIDRATYFEKCWPNSERIQTNVVEKIVGDGNEAFVTYRCVTKAGDEFRNTEFFTFNEDRISHISVYFGASYRDGSFVKQA